MKKQKQSLSIKTQPEKQTLQTYTTQDVKDAVFKMTTTGSVEPALNRLGKGGLLSKYRNGSRKEQQQIEEEALKEVSAVMYGFEAETHIALMEGFIERYQGGAKEMCKQFIRDFDCKNSVEKILAETATIAFMRYLDTSRRFNGCLTANENITPNLTGFLTMLSKQMDRSHRQYLTTIATLKQLKSPNIEMNIRTKNTFVAQNQQINANRLAEPANTENNEAK